MSELGLVGFDVTAQWIDICIRKNDVAAKVVKLPFYKK
jgi:hypothetical protein